MSPSVRETERVMIPSEDPRESMIVMPGRCCMSPAFASGENVTPDDVSARNDDRSYLSGAASSTASNGRANTSPTIVRTATRLRSTSNHTRSGSRPTSSMSTTVLAPESVDNAMNRPVPCMSGHAGSAIPVRLPARAAAIGSVGSVSGRLDTHNAR